MKPLRITDISSYTALINSFSKKWTLSNNYLLPTDISDLIEDGRLESCNDGKNCFFLVKKNGGVARLYYLLNDLDASAKFSIDLEDALVTEILFRGNVGIPEKEIEFLKTCGFKLNIRRDQFSGTLPDTNEIKPVFAKSMEDTVAAVNLFNSTFDKYSGDYISTQEIKTLFVEKALLCVYDSSDNLQGVLHTSVLGKNAWVSHLVVDKECRGQGISRKLMDMFVTNARNNECKRIMLWVRHDNEAAISLYRKYGLIYTNKSTISLIKE